MSLNNSDEIFKAIELIASTSGKNDKTALVIGFAGQSLDFVRVIEHAYNPFKTFGIAKMPERQDGGVGVFNEGTWTILRALIVRELTGYDARDAVQSELNRLSDGSAELLCRILRKKLRAGFSESTCNKAVKKLIPEFPYQRCSLPKDTDLNAWPWEEGVFVQEKADGSFANIDHEEGGVVRITTRQGNEYPIEKFEQMANDIRACLAVDHQNHGEILVLRDGIVCSRSDGNGVLNGIMSGGDFAPNESPMYLVWDQIPLVAVTPKGKHLVPYRSRFASILKQYSANTRPFVAPIPTVIVRSMDAAVTYYKKMLEQGKEGVVLKHPKAIWKDGTSKEQIKFKLEVDVDLEIVAVNLGRAGTKNEGRAAAFTCVTSDRLLYVDVAIKNEAMRDSVDADRDAWLGGIIVVRANELLEPSNSNDNYSLFLPRMAETAIRNDKTEADSLQRVKDQFESAVGG